MAYPERSIISAVMAMSLLAWPIAATPAVEEPVETREILIVSYPMGEQVTLKLEGTSRLPHARGTATLLRKDGVSKIDLELEEVKPAFLFGGHYNTYVLWAVSRDGDVRNLGELVSGKAHNTFTGESSNEAFGLIVTAEPHFLVDQPSDVVVLEGVMPAAGTAPVEVSSVTFEVLDDPYDIERDSLAGIESYEPQSSSELASVRTAVVLAESAGAAEFAAEELAEAETALRAAEAALAEENAERLKELTRQAIRRAVEARDLAEIRAFEAALQAEREVHAERIEKLEVAIEEAATQNERKELAAERSELTARIEARAREEAHRLTAEAARRAEEAEARALEAEEAKLQAEQQKAEAEQEKLAAQREKIEAERDKRRAERGALEARRQRDRARAELQNVLANIASVRESARGLIVDIPNVSFEFNSATLTPAGRETMAKIAGVLLVVRDASLSIEGHTDDVGSADYNIKLSRDRAQSVLNYLVEQGLAADQMTVKGFGETQPIASNETAEGRQENRRVEIIVLEGADFGFPTTTSE